MLSKGAVKLLNTQSSSNSFYPVLQIISIKTRKSGYLLRLSDSLNSIKSFLPSYEQVPVLYSAILVEEFEMISPLMILIKFSNVQNYSEQLGRPEKLIFSESTKGSTFTLIKSLNVNLSTWVLKLRMTYKSTCENVKNPGNYFYGIFIDENNDDILIYFNKDTFDTYYASLIVRKMYLVSRGRIRKNDRGEHKGKFVVYIDKNSKIIEIYDDHSIKQEKFTFKDIKSIYKLTLPQRVDTFGVIKAICNSGVSSIEIQDKSNSTIMLFCSHPLKNIPKFSVIVCKNVQYEPNSSVLISDSTSSLLINPKGFSEVEALRDISRSYWKTLDYVYTVAEIKDLISFECFPDEIQIIGTVSEVVFDETHPFWYPACSNVEKCSKKIESHSFGFFFCRECQSRSEKFVHRYAVEVVITDLSGSLKVKIFDSVGRQFFGCSAEELALCYLQDRDNAEEILFNVIGKHYNFIISGRQMGKSIPISKISSINPASLCKTLLSELSEALS